MIDVLAEFPAWQEYRQRVEQAEANAAEMVRQGEAAAERYRTRLAEHDRKIAEAVESGGRVPDDPPAPSRSHAAAVQRSQRNLMQVRDEQAQVLAGIAVDVEKRLLEVVAEALDEAREPAEALKACAAKISEALQVAKKVRVAVEKQQDQVERPAPSARTLAGVDVGDLVAVLDAAGGSAEGLLAPAPKPKTLGWQGDRLGGVLRDDNPPSDGGEEARQLATLPAHGDWPTVARARPGEI